MNRKIKWKCSHGGYQITNSEQNLPAKGGINKNSPYQMVSPHHYLHLKLQELLNRQPLTCSVTMHVYREMNDDQRLGEYLGV